MRNFDWLLELELKRMLDPVAAAPVPVRTWRVRRRPTADGAGRAGSTAGASAIEPKAEAAPRR